MIFFYFHNNKFVILHDTIAQVFYFNFPCAAFCHSSLCEPEGKEIPKKVRNITFSLKSAALKRGSFLQFSLYETFRTLKLKRKPNLPWH